jgi:hypothetical protein
VTIPHLSPPRMQDVRIHFTPSRNLSTAAPSSSRRTAAFLNSRVNFRRDNPMNHILLLPSVSVNPLSQFWGPLHRSPGRVAQPEGQFVHIIKLAELIELCFRSGLTSGSPPSPAQRTCRPEPLISPLGQSARRNMLCAVILRLVGVWRKHFVAEAAMTLRPF